MSIASFDKVAILGMATGITIYCSFFNNKNPLNHEGKCVACAHSVMSLVTDLAFLQLAYDLGKNFLKAKDKGYFLLLNASILMGLALGGKFCNELRNEIDRVELPTLSHRTVQYYFLFCLSVITFLALRKIVKQPTKESKNVLLAA